MEDKTNYGLLAYNRCDELSQQFFALKAKASSVDLTKGIRRIVSSGTAVVINTSNNEDIHSWIKYEDGWCEYVVQRTMVSGSSSGTIDILGGVRGTLQYTTFLNGSENISQTETLKNQVFPQGIKVYNLQSTCFTIGTTVQTVVPTFNIRQGILNQTFTTTMTYQSGGSGNNFSWFIQGYWK